MKSELSPTTSSKNLDLDCHLKAEMNSTLGDSSSNLVMTVEKTAYVSLEGSHYSSDFRYNWRVTKKKNFSNKCCTFIKNNNVRCYSNYLRESDKSEYNSQDQLYTLCQRFDKSAASYDKKLRTVSRIIIYKLLCSYII